MQDTGISSKAMSIMNSFINDIFEKIGAETAVSFSQLCDLIHEDISLQSRIDQAINNLHDRPTYPLRC